MRRIASLLLAATVLFVGAEAFACSCRPGCDDAIAVGISVPENVKGIGVIPCPRTFLGGDQDLLRDDVALPEVDKNTTREQLRRRRARSRKADVTLARRDGDSWKRVEHTITTNGVKVIGPKKPWKVGQDWRLTVGKTTKEFSIKKTLPVSDVIIDVEVTDPVVEMVSYPAGAACSFSKEATRYEVSLQFPESVAAYRHLFVVTQKADGVSYQHRTSLCSKDKPTRIYLDQTYLVPLECPPKPADGGEAPEPEPVAITYEASIPGVDVAIGVASPDPFTAICDAADEADEASETDEADEANETAPDSAAADAPTPDAPTPDAPTPDAPPTAAEATPESTESGDDSWAMVAMGLGLALILSLIIGSKITTDS